jgi:hypothetical protein
MAIGIQINAAEFKAVVAGLPDDSHLTVQFDTGITEGLERRLGQVRNVYLNKNALIIEAGDNNQG